MKLVKCNGKKLVVYDVGKVRFELVAGTTPIKLNGTILLDDDKARELVRELIAAQKIPIQPPKEGT
jgi:hypothetical protein